jgi:hypothetical protein
MFTHCLESPINLGNRQNATFSGDSHRQPAGRETLQRRAGSNCSLAPVIALGIELRPLEFDQHLNRPNLLTMQQFLRSIL